MFVINLDYIGKKIRELRLRQRKTQQQIADECNISKSLLSKIENGQTSSAIATLSKISKALNVSLSWLLDDKTEQDIVLLPRNQRQSKVGDEHMGYSYELLANRSPFTRVEPTIVYVTPKHENIRKEMYTHEHDEFIYELTGNRVEIKPEPKRKVKISYLFSPKLRRRTIFVTGFWFCYATAYYGISMYTPTILSAFTEGSQQATYIASSIVSIIGLVGAFIGMNLVEIWGRRPLLITSFAGLTTALVILTINSHPTLTFLVILFSIAVLFSNMGGGILNFVYPTELFPTNIRAGASGFATSISRIGSILGVLVFLNLVAAWGNSVALGFFAFIGFQD